MLKSLYFYLVAMSPLGAFLILKNNFKIGFILVFLCLFSFFWRCFSVINSSRYYSVLIIYGIVFSTYAIFILISKTYNKQIKRFIFCFFMISIFLVHSQKVFLSFRNNYIIDISTMLKSYSKHNPNDFICVYDNEFGRIRDIANLAYPQIMLITDEFSYDFTDLYTKNCCFTSNCLFVVPENQSSINASRDRCNDINQYTKVEHFFSSSSHYKFISIYKHFPYNLSPSPDFANCLDSANLKVYIPEYDAYIYQKDDKILWFIGADIDKETEIIFHLHTNKPELLPPSRRLNGFDNLSTRIGSTCDKGMRGKYHFFERSIPSQYPISYIRVGFNKNGKVIWRVLFLSSPYG